MGKKKNQSHSLAHRPLLFQGIHKWHWPWLEEQLVIRLLQMPFFFSVSPLSQVFRCYDQIEWVHERPTGASLLSFLRDSTDQWNREDSGLAEGSNAGNPRPEDQGSSRLWWKGCMGCSLQGCHTDLWDRGECLCVCVCTLECLTWTLQSSAWSVWGCVDALYNVLSVPTLKREADSSPGSKDVKLPQWRKEGKRTEKAEETQRVREITHSSHSSSLTTSKVHYI